MGGVIFKKRHLEVVQISANAPTSESEVTEPTELQTPIALVGIDVDGTLLRSDKSLTKKTAQAVMDARDAGVKIVLASARPPRSMQPVYKYLGLESLQISYNGGLVHDPVRSRHVYHKALAMQLSGRVIDVARKAVPDCLVAVEILDQWCTDRDDTNWPKETMLKYEPTVVGPVKDFITAPVTKLMFLGETKQIMAVRAAVLKKFPKEIAVAVSDKHLIQIINPDVEKADALAMVAAQYGIQREQCMALGDAPNDLGMLRWAGLGVAVENAWPEVLEAADAVVPSCDQDGVAVAIRRFILSRL